MRAILDWIGIFFLADLGLAFLLCFFVVMLGCMQEKSRAIKSALVMLIFFAIALGTLYAGIRLIVLGISTGNAN